MNKKIVYIILSVLFGIAVIGKIVMVYIKTHDKSLNRELVGTWSCHVNGQINLDDEYGTATGDETCTYYDDGTYYNDGTFVYNFTITGGGADGYWDDYWEGVVYSVKIKETESGNWKVKGNEIIYNPTEINRKFLWGKTNLTDRQENKKIIDYLRENWSTVTKDEYESWSETIIKKTPQKMTTKFSDDGYTSTSVCKRIAQ